MNLPENICNLIDIMPCAAMVYDIGENRVLFCNHIAESELDIHVGTTSKDVGVILHNMNLSDEMYTTLKSKLAEMKKYEYKNIFITTKHDEIHQMDLNVSYVDYKKNSVYILLSRSKNEVELMEQQKLYYDSISSASYSYPFYLDVKARCIQLFDPELEKYNMAMTMENFPETVIKSGYVYEDDIDAYLETIDRMYKGKSPEGSFRFYDPQGELLTYTVNYVVHRDELGEPIEVSGDFIIQSETKMKMMQEIFDDENAKPQQKVVLAHQIKAHFFFNTLNTISALCKQDAIKADHAIMTFATYMRSYMHLISEDENIEFNKELSLVKSTLEIEKLRFSDSFTYEFDLQETDFDIPPLTIQPIVENALLHGLRRTGKHGHLKISSYQEDNVIKIIVQDNGLGFHTSVLEKSKSIGLRNLTKRLELMVDGTVTINSTLGKGTEVIIEIPVCDNILTPIY
ncbi:MAG: histidine kinase [Clostridia bacterium]